MDIKTCLAMKEGLIVSWKEFIESLPEPNQKEVSEMVTRFNAMSPDEIDDLKEQMTAYLLGRFRT